jgi:hypothetical protein
MSPRLFDRCDIVRVSTVATAAFALSFRRIANAAHTC